MAKLAVVDVGTNSIHMVLAEIEPDGSYKILDRFKDMTRLGDGTFQHGFLSKAAMTKGLEVLRNLTVLARNKGYERIIMVATSAVREARNGGRFIEEVARQTGIRVHVVTGQEEARLIYLGVRHSIDLTDRPSLVVDVGGGSVELIVGDRKNLIRARSLKLGAIRLKDQFLTKDPPAKPKIREMQRTIDSQLKQTLDQLKTDDFNRLVASSGMAGNLAEIAYLRRTGSPIPQLNLATITLKEMKAIEGLLLTKRVKDRLAIPGLDPRRVDTLLPAAVVIRRLMERIGHKEVTLSDKAIREGLIYDFIEKNREGLRVEQEIPNLRLRNVIYLARRCRYPKKHSHHIAGLATSLFDQTQPLHGLGKREREWLQYAALLHDVGYLIHDRQHHKHAYYVIKNSNIPGLTAEEIEIIANVARYHRGALPGTHHLPYKALPSGHRKTLVVLSALLRIADGLDRSHFSVIQGVQVKLGKTIRIKLDTLGESELEVWTARMRSNLFQRVFRRKVEFVAQAQ